MSRLNLGVFGKGIGIYDDNGAVHTEAVAAICEIMGPQVDRLIWEAPLKNQQSFLIQQFGPKRQSWQYSNGRSALSGITQGYALKPSIALLRN